MNTMNNRRRRESTERIEREFLGQLQTKALQKITVAGLCKQCGINRSTFYANYRDIDDLAERCREKLEQEVKQLYGGEVAWDFESCDILKLLGHIQDNQLFYRTYFKLGYDARYRAKPYELQQARQRFGDQYAGYHVEFFRNGFNAVVKLWLAGGCRESPEEIGEILRLEYRERGK